LKKEKLLLLSAAILAILLVGSAFFQNIYWGAIVAVVSSSELPPETAKSELVTDILRLLVLVTLHSVVSSLQTALIKIAALRTSMEAKMSLFSSLMSRNVEFFDSKVPGELMSRLTSDTDALMESSSHAVNLVSGVCMFVGGFGFLLYLNWKLTLIMLAAAPVIGIVTWILSKVNAKTTKLSLTSSAKAVTVAEEVLNATSTVFAYRTQAFECNRYGQNAFISFLLLRKQTILNGVGDFVIYFSFNIIVIGAMYYAGMQVLNKEGTVKETVTFLLIVFDLTLEIEKIPGSFYSISAGVGASSRIAYHVRQAKADRERREKLLLSKQVNDKDLDPFVVVAQDVWFEYPSRPEVKVLQGLSFKLAHNESIGICGSSGSGKSTILKLLFRHYEFQQGFLGLCGQAIEYLSDDQMREQLSLVPQEPLLFNMTIGENISYGSELDQEQIVRAAQMCNAHGFISDLPDGYDTMVGSKGVQLSGGQRQRIAIARAVAKEGVCLALDEPTSSLDFASRTAVVETIKEVLQKKERSVILISHQLALLKHCDRILMLDKGKIVEAGTHAALVAHSEPYRGLFGL
jgi:ABC-type multidrug transport system fused ATPase/permease subunit